MTINWVFTHQYRLFRDITPSYQAVTIRSQFMQRFLDFPTAAVGLIWRELLLHCTVSCPCGTLRSAPTSSSSFLSAWVTQISVECFSSIEFPYFLPFKTHLPWPKKAPKSRLHLMAVPAGYRWLGKRYGFSLHLIKSSCNYSEDGPNQGASDAILTRHWV